MAKNVQKTETDWFVTGNIRKTLQDAYAKECGKKTQSTIGPLLKKIIEDLKKDGLQRYPRGDIWAAKMSGFIDQIIRTIFDCALEDGSETPIAVVAVGGYGRGELSPCSDIDLLFLHSARKEAIARPILDKILYALWDSGQKIGHGVHTPASAISFCTDDMNGRTAYLESRFIAGNTDIYDDFVSRYEKLRLATIPEFIKSKLQEQDIRHDQFEQSRFLVEPNIKEGKGGLRDLHTIGWLYHYTYGYPIGNNSQSKPVLEKQDYQSFQKARRFLLTARAHLHMIRCSDDNHLSFDIQPELATSLEYTARHNMAPAERLMKHYFVTASNIGSLTRIFCARLEENRTKRLPSLPKMLPRKLLDDGIKAKPNLRLRNGRLDFDKPSLAKQNPLHWFRLINAFAKQDKLDLHPSALALISQNLSEVTRSTREDPKIATLFRSIIMQSKDPVKTMRILGETGLMGKYIPAYGKITGRIVYGLYRRFSLDEQTIHAMEILHEIQKGNENKLHPIASSHVNKAKDPYPFFLAVLFHELTYSVTDRDPEKCQALIKRICMRLGVDDGMATEIGWASANRTLMIDTIERRMLADPRTIERFCNEVQSLSRLYLLLVVTICHLRVVSFNAWDDRLRRQLTTLVESAAEWFEGGETALLHYQHKRARKSRGLIAKELSNWNEEERAWLIERLAPLALHTVEPALWGKFAPLMKRAEKDNLPGAVSASLRNDGTIEAIIYGPDRDGLLSDLAGAVSSLGISFRSVQAITTIDRKIIDIFVLQSIDGQPLTDKGLVTRLHDTLLQTITNPPKSPPKPSRRLGDRRSIFNVEPSVHLNHDASDDCLVVEAVGLDQPGLLHKLTLALTEIGVIIRSAHVATYGERAVDTFYLQDAPGYKITDKRRLQSIERRLRSVLCASGSP